MEKTLLKGIKLSLLGFGLCSSLFLTYSCNNLNKNSDSTSTEQSTEKANKPNIAEGSIVYFNLDKVIAEYDMANELKATVSSKLEGIQQELTRRGNKLQGELNSFNEKLNKGLITRSTAEVQGQELQKKQNEFNTYYTQKQQEIAEEQQVLLNQIGNAIKEFLDSYNAEKKYGLIISTQGDILPSPVVTGDSSLDITADIIEKINEQYIKDKKNGNSSITKKEEKTK